jgi:hypothetical protein
MLEDSIDVEVLNEAGVVLAVVPVVYEPLTRCVVGNAPADRCGIASYFRVGDAVFPFLPRFHVVVLERVHLGLTIDDRGVRLSGPMQWKQLRAMAAMGHDRLAVEPGLQCTCPSLLNGHHPGCPLS